MTCFRRLGSRVGRQLIFQKWHPGKVMHEMQEIHFKSAFFLSPSVETPGQIPQDQTEISLYVLNKLTLLHRAII